MFFTLKSFIFSFNFIKKPLILFIFFNIIP
nr:MAG TPA: hypothetical protein [Caudoviricetes sp.]